MIKSRKISESEVDVAYKKMGRTKLIRKYLQVHYLDQYQMQLSILMARYAPQQMIWKLVDKEARTELLQTVVKVQIRTVSLMVTSKSHNNKGSQRLMIAKRFVGREQLRSIKMQRVANAMLVIGHMLTLKAATK